MIVAVGTHAEDDDPCAIVDIYLACSGECEDELQAAHEDGDTTTIRCWNLAELSRKPGIGPTRSSTAWPHDYSPGFGKLAMYMEMKADSKSMLPTLPYTEQAPGWPAAGRHILAHHDEATVIVYQAYRSAISRYAIEHGRFGGDAFSWSRMSWIKPNFLWMMYRSGWGTKEGQEATLAVRLPRAFFDYLLACAVPSTWDPKAYPTPEAWQDAVAHSDVRVQWDPDHNPAGAPLARRAVQLGLRGEALRRYGQHDLVEIIDLTAFVAEQREHARVRGFTSLVTPVETVYRPASPEVGTRLGLVQAAQKMEAGG